MRFAFLCAAWLAACASSQPGKSKPCTQDTECQDPAQPYCVMGTCGACNGPTTCTIDQPRCAPDTLTCEMCVADTDCSLYADRPHCGHATCVQCVASSQCENPMPVCDSMTDTCRGCRTDSECLSQVCDVGQGQCVSTDTILYAADTAAMTSACTQTDPCSLAKAISSVTFVKPTVRMLPGIYSTPQIIAGTTTMTIVATGASLTTTSVGTGLEVRDGANVTIRGLQMNIDGQAIYCHATTGIATLALDNVSVMSAGYGIAAQSCNLTLSQVTLPTGLDPAGANTTATIDRSLLYIRADAGMASGGGGISITATNSVFHSFDFSKAGNASIHVSYSTFTSAENCTSVSGTPTALFEASIFYAPGQTNAISGTACTFSHDLAFPQAMGAGMFTTTQDPKLVDPAHGDYHLMAGSPAIDVAPAGVTDDHDYDGTLRPQGNANDLGAFEKK